MAVEWKFFLAHSYGATMPSIGELVGAQSKTLGLTLNRGGTLSFQIPLVAEIAYEVWPIETCVKAYRNDRLVWSGPVWNLEESANASQATLTVNCVGWQTLLEKRILRDQITYAGPVDDTQIAVDLINALNNDTGTPLPFSNVDGEVLSAPSRSWIAGTQVNSTNPDGSAYTQAMRNPGVFAPYQTNVSSVIQQYSDVENGYDYWVDPVTRVMNFWRKRSKRSEAVFGFGWGPKNLAAATRQWDVGSLCNWMIAYGAQNVAPAIEPTIITDSQRRYGVFQETASLSDVKSNDDLNAYATEETALREYPRQIWSISPFPYRVDDNVPQIFEDYDIGDIVHFVVKHGRLDSGGEQGARIFGATINIDANNNETISSLNIYAGG